MTDLWGRVGAYFRPTRNGGSNFFKPSNFGTGAFYKNTITHEYCLGLSGDKQRLFLSISFERVRRIGTFLVQATNSHA